MDKRRSICLRQNLLSGIFFLGMVCCVLGERLVNEGLLETEMLDQVGNSTPVPQVHKDEAVSNVSHYVPEAPTTATHLPKSIDIQVSANIFSPSLEAVESQYRNDMQDAQNSSQADKEISNDRFEISTSFSVSYLEYEENEKHTQELTTVAAGKMDQADFENQHHFESVSSVSLETHYNTETPNISTILLTEFANHLRNTTSISLVPMTDVQVSQIYDADHLTTEVTSKIHHTTDLDTSEKPYIKIIFDQNLEMMMNSTERSLLAPDFLEFAGTGENNLVPDAGGNNTSLNISVGHLLLSTVNSDKEGTTLAADGGYVAATKVQDEVTVTNEINVTLAGPPALGENDVSISSILSRDDTDENILAATSRAGQEVSSEDDLNAIIMDIDNYTLSRSTTASSETTEMNTVRVSHTESGSSLEYDMFLESNQSSSENLRGAEEDIRGNISKEQRKRNCERQEGCEGEHVGSTHLLNTLVIPTVYTSTEQHTTEFVSDETVTQAHGTSSEEEVSEEMGFVEVTTEIYTVLPIAVEVYSTNHHKRSTFVTSGTEIEHRSSLLTVTTWPDSETASSAISTNSDEEMLTFSDDRERRETNSDITSPDYHWKLMNYSSISSNVSEDIARNESLSDAQKPDERTVTENSDLQEETTSFIDAQPSELDTVLSSVGINPTVSTNTFMNEYNALSTTDILLEEAMHQGTDSASHTSSFASICADTLDRNFNCITTAEKAQTTVYEINETVNELLMQEENNTETSTEQNTKSVEFYDSDNEQNNLTDPHSASVSYKLARESPSSSIKSSFGDPTQASTREINISHQISTRPPLGSTPEILISSSHFTLPEVSVDSAESVERLGQESEEVFAKISNGTADFRAVSDSDIVSPIYNQSLRTSNQQNSSGESFLTEVSTEEMNPSLQISTQSRLPRISEILHSSSHFSLPELLTQRTDLFKYLSQESEQALSQSVENMVLDKHSHVSDSDIISSSSNNQSLRSTDLRNSFDEYLPTVVSANGINTSFQIFKQFPLPNTSEILLSSSHFTLPELPMEITDPFEYSSQESEQASSPFMESLVLEKHSHVADSGTISLSTDQSLRSTDRNNPLNESLTTEVSTKEMNTPYQISTQNHLPNTSTIFISSSHFSLPELPTESTDHFEFLSHGSEQVSSRFTQSVVLDKHSHTADSEIVSLTNKQSLGFIDPHNSPLQEAITVSLKESDSLEASDSEIISFSINQTTTLIFAGISGIQEIAISSLSLGEESTSSEASTGSLTTADHYEFSESEMLSSQQKHKIPTSSSAPRKTAASTVQDSHSDVDFSFHSSEERDCSSVTAHMIYTESDSVITPTHLTEPPEITEASFTSEFLLDGSKSTVDYISFTDVSEVTPSSQLTKNIHVDQNLSTCLHLMLSKRSVWNAVESTIYTVSDNIIKRPHMTNVLYRVNDFPVSSTISEESVNATSSLSSMETIQPRSSETLTSAVSLTTDDSVTNMTKRMEDDQKEKESTFGQDYSSDSMLESTEISTTEHSTHKYTQEFLTTQSKTLITRKAFESLTIDEINNTITVVFRIAGDVEWIDLYTKRFSEWMAKMLLAEIKEHKMKSTSSDVSGFQGKSSGNPTRVELIYVLPSPYIISEDLIFTFFALMVPDNDTIPLSKVIDALLSDTEGMQSCMNLNLSYFIRGQYLMPNERDAWTSLDHVWQKHGILLLTISVLTLFIVVILVAAVVYLRCKSRRSVAYISEKDRLHHDLHDSTEIGDLNRGSVILQDEIYEKDPSVANGNHVPTIGDDEGWLVPINDVPVEDQDAPEIQDTKL